MSKSLINLNNKNKYVLPSVYSSYRDKLTIEHKELNLSPEHVLLQCDELLEDKQLIKIQGIEKSITRLNQITNKIENFTNRNNSFILINEMQRLRKEELLPVNYHMFNPKPNSDSLESANLNVELNSNLETKYIESDGNKNYLNNNIELKFPLSLLTTNSKEFKFRNYLQLITKFDSAFISSQNVSYKFNKLNYKIVKNIYTILYSSFLNMKCAISKPRMYFSNDLIIIKLFYFPKAQLNKYLENSKYIIYKKLINFYKLYKFRKSIKNKFRKKIITKFDNNLISTNNFKSNRNLMLNKIETIKKDLQYKSKFLKLNSEQLEETCKILSNLLHKPVQLELVRLHYPFYDSNILANILSKLISYIKLRYIFNKIFKIAVIKNPTKMIQKKRFSALPGYLTGISLKFAGRLPTQRIVPRKTVKTKDIGSVARKKAILVETARFSNKNRRGSFSITISTGFYLANNIK
jgi:Mitochondrial ribosomal protein (VAR1)